MIGLPPLGQRVTIIDTNDRTGSVVGHGTHFPRPDDRTHQPQAIVLVELDECVWTAERDMSIPVLVVHPDNIRVVET